MLGRAIADEFRRFGNVVVLDVGSAGDRFAETRMGGHVGKEEQLGQLLRLERDIVRRPDGDVGRQSPEACRGGGVSGNHHRILTGSGRR